MCVCVCKGGRGERKRETESEKETEREKERDESVGTTVRPQHRADPLALTLLWHPQHRHELLRNAIRRLGMHRLRPCSVWRLGTS